jgi:Serine hydroxymethyltransferase
MTTVPKSLPGNVALEQHDPEMYDLIEKEKTRQWSCLELIASENFTSRAVMECLGSALTNKVKYDSLYSTQCASYIEPELARLFHAAMLPLIAAKACNCIKML